MRILSLLSFGFRCLRLHFCPPLRALTRCFICAILARRLKGRKDRRDRDERVFDEFIAGGYDAKPAKSANKAILMYRQKVDLVGVTNFHSTRKNFYTRIMELDVNNAWYSMYVGHALENMAKVYGKRTPTILTNVAKAIRYPAKVEKAFKVALGL